MESPTPPKAPSLRELVGKALRYSRIAVLVGVVVWLPVAAVAWWTSRPGPAGQLAHTDEYSFTPMPEDLAPLRKWTARQSGVANVEVRRVTKPNKEGPLEVIEMRYGSSRREALAPPWKELGYPKPEQATHHWSGKLRIALARGIGFYAFLLARCLDLGFLIAAIVWFRRARRSGQPLPGLFRGPRRPAALWGLGTGLVLAGLALLYWWLVPLASSRGIAGAWPMTVFWPTWAQVLSLLLVPVVFPVCQESFFRGAVLGSFQNADRPKTGILVSALLFTVAQLSLREAPVFFVMGLVLAWLYNRMGSLLAPLVAASVCAAVAITLPSFWIGPELVEEVTKRMLEALQGAGK